MSDPRRQIPSIDRLVEAPEFSELRDTYTLDRVVGGLREVVSSVRREVESGGEVAPPSDPASYAEQTRALLELEDRISLQSVVNASGVVIHTNLGRAPIAERARAAMAKVSAGYSNLEYDLEEGRRGSRYVHCVDLLRDLTGAEDALVVNNGAAALVLALNTLALGRAVTVSRGELVEIGGGFRIPEILERAGARLVEVGSTNRTTLDDYREAITHETGALLKVHHSNFRISGFTASVALAELAELARERSLPLVHDLGSGLLVDPTTLGLPEEPRPVESVAAGADVVVFSGDKLMGGPQGGLIVGRTEWIQAMRENPLCRALRVDKVTLAGLEATLRIHREGGSAWREIPALEALATSLAELESRARRIIQTLEGSTVRLDLVESTAVPGGGTYPGVEIPSRALAVHLPGCSASVLEERLRKGDPPVIGRVEGDRVLLDLRTVSPAEDRILADALGALAQ